jgi:uncharacterized protein YndB with AHSA1/START domain
MSTTHTTEVTAEPGAHDLTVTRTFDAPRDLVYRAWADPRLLERWMGPRSLTMEVETWEIDRGGPWRFVNRDAEGGEYRFHGSFHGTSSPDDGITWTFEFEGAPGHVALDHIAFTEVDGRTVVHTHSVHQSVAARDAMIESGMEHGLTEGYAKLDELLASQGAGV